MNVLITGVSQGIGRELVMQFLNSTLVTKIYACTSSNKTLDFDDSRVEVVKLDLTNESSINLVYDKIDKNGIDLLINNAGYLHSDLVENISMDEVRHMFEVNFFGPFRLIKTLLPHLKRTNGQVINVGSMGGFQGSSKFKGLAAYSSSKSALSCLSECLAEEFALDGVHVNCLALGSVDTEMLKKAFPDYQAQASTKEIGAFIKSFSECSGKLINGKTIPVSTITP